MKTFAVLVSIITTLVVGVIEAYARPVGMPPILNLVLDEETQNELIWPIVDGRYGQPQNVFTLPTPGSGKGLYYPDIQASFPNVNWQTIDRLYIPAAHYLFIRVGNLPIRSSDRPLIITNSGGQVRVGGLGHHYLMSLGGGSNWVLTGRYDPISETGHADFTGHRGGRFDGSRGKYGILIDDEFVRNSISGLGIGNEATHFEIEYIEITRVGFAGMLIKSDNLGNAHMDSVSIHDCYIHDTKSEGIYAGSTQTQPQHQLRNWQIYNNRILRTGTEALQLGQLAGKNKIHHNVIGPAAIDWRAAFNQYQDSNLQVGIREGETSVYNNIFIGAANSMISMFTSNLAGDSTQDNVGFRFSDNYLSGMRFLGLYQNATTVANMSYVFERNAFRNWRFDRDDVYPTSQQPDHLLRTVNTSSALSFVDNIWQAPNKLNNLLATGNGSNGNVSGSGNVLSSSEPVQFQNSGLPANFDYLNMEMWTDVATLNNDEPVSYEEGDIVMHLAHPYRCKLPTCAAGLVPPNNPDTWQDLPELTDDVRVVPSSVWKHIGLTSSDF